MLSYLTSLVQVERRPKKGGFAGFGGSRSKIGASRKKQEEKGQKKGDFHSQFNLYMPVVVNIIKQTPYRKYRST